MSSTLLTTPSHSAGRIAVFGPGAIGGFLGICLSAAGFEVKLFGRKNGRSGTAPLCSAVTSRGKNVYPSQELVVYHDPEEAKDCQAALVAVKGSATVKVAETLAEVLPQDTLVVSFQNGLNNPDKLRSILSQQVAAGIVAFNVVSTAGQRSQTTKGKLYVESVRHPMAGLLVDGFQRIGQAARLVPNIEGLMAGKLLLNLHNGVSAATGMMTWDTLMDDATRRCYVACLREGLRVLRSAGLHPRSVLPLPLEWVVGGLSLPSALIRACCLPAVPSGGGAKSSTLVDLCAGRKCEIDELNGEIVRLAEAGGGAAPANAAVCRVVHGLEGQDSPAFLSGQELEALIQVKHR